MVSDATSAGLGGLQTATQKLADSADNVAKFASQAGRTPELNRAVQQQTGPKSLKDPNEKEALVDLSKERVDQVRAQVAAEASLRVIEADAETKGRIVDLTA